MAKKNTPQRNPLETTLSASLPKRLKNSIMGRSKLLDRPMSQLLRYALEFHEARGWRDVVVDGMTFAVLSPKAEARLREWLDSEKDISEL